MVKITRDYQEGYCNVCKNETLVRILIGNKLMAGVCRNCIKCVGEMTINELLSKFGEEINLNAS